jgi:A/G-specific adenine glycosylase
MKFSNTLIQWYLQNKRDLPWRNTTNPYQFGSQKSCYNKHVLRKERLIFLLFYCISTVFDLAAANEEQVLKLWQG